MRLFIKLMILLMVFAAIGPFFIKGPDGQPLLTIDDINAPALPSWSELGDQARQGLASLNSSDESKSLQVYKWTDGDGVVHYSNQAGAATDAKLTTIDKITVLPLDPAESGLSSEAQTTAPAIDLPTPSFTSIPIDKIPKLIEDAKQTQQRVVDRKKAMDAAIDAK